jgi:hypothetical protein
MTCGGFFDIQRRRIVAEPCAFRKQSATRCAVADTVPARAAFAAYCELRADFRNFRPDRMRDLALRHDAFDGSDGIDLDAFVRRMKEDREDSQPPA